MNEETFKRMKEMMARTIYLEMEGIAVIERILHGIEKSDTSENLVQEARDILSGA